MASVTAIDVAALLAPISDASPWGVDCRLNASVSSAYQLIKTARNSAREIERKNATGADLGNPDDEWRKVLELAPKILRQESKDLEVACWYAEGLLRRQGFSGLRDAFLLIKGLVEQYWDNLYPAPDEDGLETKVAPLTGLNGAGQEGVLISAMRSTTITQGNSVGPFLYWECQKAQATQRIQDADNREKEFNKLGFTFADVEKAMAETSSQFIVDLRDDLVECIDLYRQISQRLDELCGAYDAPPTSLVIATLDECLSSVKHLGQNKFPVAAVAADPTNATDDGVTPAAQINAGGTVGPIASREQAFKQLLEISEYFRKREPHSPISYMLEKAVKWGNMSLSELMQELISDRNVLEQYSKLTGVKTED
jgi:type VI secretion system protein ImpA